MRGEQVSPEFFDMVTVYFCDICGFTTIAAACSALDVISFLNELFSKFDGIVETADAYKVETIGDAYMVSHRNGILYIW